MMMVILFLHLCQTVPKFWKGFLEKRLAEAEAGLFKTLSFATDVHFFIFFSDDADAVIPFYLFFCFVSALPHPKSQFERKDG